MKFSWNNAFKAFGICFGISGLSGFFLLMLITDSEFLAIFGAKVAAILLSFACFGSPIIATIVGFLYRDDKNE